MAKAIIKFTAQPYSVNGYTGYRPQLETQDGIYDLDFCREVVTEKRLAMSAEELLHAINMLGEVGPAKVAADGRPRGVTRLLKYGRFARGKLESPVSPWNTTCRAYVRPQLLGDAEKEIDATFTNVNPAISVRLDNVTWVGAQSVVNVVKVGTEFAAYGRHMEWIDGDEATLTVGETAYPLTCTASDVAHAVFPWPAGLSPEAGTPATFEMRSRGGVPDGDVYTSRKEVVVIAGDAPMPATPTVTKVTQDGRPDNTVRLASSSPLTIHGRNLSMGITDRVWIELWRDGVKADYGDCTGKITSATDTAIALSGVVWGSESGPDSAWWNKYPNSKFVLVIGGTRYEFPVTFVE